MMFMAVASLVVADDLSESDRRTQEGRERQGDRRLYRLPRQEPGRERGLAGVSVPRRLVRRQEGLRPRDRRLRGKRHLAARQLDGARQARQHLHAPQGRSRQGDRRLHRSPEARAQELLRPIRARPLLPAQEGVRQGDLGFQPGDRTSPDVDLTARRSGERRTPPLGENDKAISDYDAAIKLNPGDAKVAPVLR